MRNRGMTILVAAILVSLLPTAGFAQITAYSQDFESMIQTDPNALANDGWLVYGNVFGPDGTTYLYGYGPYVAPNNEFGFCQIDMGQGGVDQGLNQLVVFSDYNNTDHANGDFIESNVYREWVIDASNVGDTWEFFFEAKLGNIEGASTAAAFIKTLDPNSGYALTNFITEDMTSIPATWTGFTLQLPIDASLVGQIFQIGFLNLATNYEGSGIFYDNLDLRLTDPTAAPPSSQLMNTELSQNYPNPFNPSTRIDFALDVSTSVALSVYDLAGRHVATLLRGDLDAGEHHVVWNGRNDGGASVASGRYQYVLTTQEGRLSRSMLLLK